MFVPIRRRHLCAQDYLPRVRGDAHFELEGGTLTRRHCEHSEAIQTAAAERFWIASLCSQ